MQEDYASDDSPNDYDTGIHIKEEDHRLRLDQAHYKGNYPTRFHIYVYFSKYNLLTLSSSTCEVPRGVSGGRQLQCPGLVAQFEGLEGGSYL